MTYPEGFLVMKRDWHYHQRLHERYGITLRPGEHRNLTNQVVFRKVPSFVREGGGERVWLTTIRGQQVLSIASDEGVLITVLQDQKIHRMAS